jgi:inositol oxygenase
MSGSSPGEFTIAKPEIGPHDRVRSGNAKVQRTRSETEPIHADGRAFRDFSESARASVRDLYRLNHSRQTLGFVLAKKGEYLPLRKCRMSLWDAFERLDEIVDVSDPDTECTQLEHALQTAEALRRDNQPRWMVLAGLIHDLGKILTLFGEPQWAVVGDTFPVGCAFADTVVHADLFSANADRTNSLYSTRCGIYQEGCGLDAVHMSWGHDEYLYHVVKPFVPPEVAYIVRYHSFYAAHRDGSYGWLMNEQDRVMMRWVRAFNPYDLYSKADDLPRGPRLRSEYRKLVDEYFPPLLQW